MVEDLKDRWEVEGTVPCGGPPGTTSPGGAAIVKTSKTSSQIVDSACIAKRWRFNSKSW